MATDEDGHRGEITVEVSRSGGHHHARRDAVHSLALEHGLFSRRTWYTPWINGKSICGDGIARLHPAQLTLTGDASELAAFTAALPRLLDAVERAADQALRQLGTWLRDTAAGQAVAEDRDLRPLRTRWRRDFITALARDRALGRAAALPEPDRAARWDLLAEHFARTAAHHLDPAGCADPQAAARIIAQAVADQPLTDPQRQERDRLRRRRSILDWPEYQINPEIGDVVTTAGPRRHEVTTAPPTAQLVDLLQTGTTLHRRLLHLTA